MPPVPSYQTAYDQTASVYQPQTDLVNSQIADLPNQENATLSSLDQAKANAFKDIGDSANAKGVLFSGFTPDQQAQYVGTKYLPAVAAAKEATTNAKTTLLGKINDINLQRSQVAQGTVSAAQTAAAKVEAANVAAAAKPVDPFKGYTTKASGGGTAFYGPGDQPITAAQYYSNTGGGLQSLSQFLQNDKNSKGAYTDFVSGKLTPAQLQKKYPYIFGGV